MNEGKVKVSIMKVIIVGTAGVGKTCVYCLLMGLEPPDPDKRTSTECAKRPIRVVRIGGIEDGKWEKVDLKQMIAEAVPILCERLKKYGQKEKDIEVKSGTGDEAETERVAGVSKPKKNPFKIAIEGVVLELEKLLAQHLSKEQLFETPPHISLEKQAIYLTDSGGQQAFWDLIPIFVHDSSAILFVHRLCDKLEEKPLNELYKEGQRIGPSQRASLTTAEAFKLMCQGLQPDNESKVIVVGTHKDIFEAEEEQHDEGVSAKNEKFGSDIPESAKVYCDESMSNVIFAVNTPLQGRKIKTLPEQ